MAPAAGFPHSSAAPDPSRAVNIFAGASAAGRRRLRLLALTRTDSDDLAFALDEPPRRCTASSSRAAAKQAALIGQVRAALAYDPLRERAVRERGAGRAALVTLDGLPDLYTAALLRRAATERGWQDQPHDLAALDVVRGAPGRDAPVAGAWSPDRLAVAAAGALDALRAAWPEAPDPMLAAMPEERLREMATDRAKRQVQMTAWRRRDDEWTARIAAWMHEDADTPPPLPPALSADERRACCPLWQRRRLRAEAGRSRQWWSAALSTTGRGAAPYADGYSVERWQERQEHSREWAEAHVLRWQDGIEASLADVQRSSREAQVARLYAVLRGLDDLAVAAGRGTAIMITLTLPPEWHPAPAVGARTWTPGHSPERADRELQTRWARLRALLHAAGLPPLGLRVVEPHRDGCPHLHALLYLAPLHPRGLYGPPTPEQGIRAALRAVARALRSRGVAPGRKASHMTVIDRARAKPSTYVMKYLTKSLSDAGAAARLAGADDGGEDRHLEHHCAVRAWASERRLRRYALLGVHGVQGIWQRLLRASDDEVAGAPEPVARAVGALRDRRWADALDALGAIRRPGQARPVRLAYETDAVIRIPERPTPLTSAYGDPVRRPAAVVCPAAPEWRLALRPRGPARIVRAAEHAENINDCSGLTVVESCPRPGAAPRAILRCQAPEMVLGRPRDALEGGLQPRGPPGRHSPPRKGVNDFAGA